MNTMKMTKIFLAMLFTHSVNIVAQTTLVGQVKTTQGDVVPFAIIGIKNTQLSAICNAEGNFKFTNLKNGNYIFVTKSLGYLDREDTLNISEGSSFNPLLVPSNKQLDEVIVNANRIDKNNGMAFNNLDKETIAKQNLGQDAPFLLNQLPNVVVNSDAGNGVGYTGIRIRGSDGTRINVTVNGVPINDAESQGTFFVNMPDLVSSVNNIQVQRGVGASSNGAGAFGASINFQTNELKEKAYANVISTAGSFNTYRNTLAAGTGLLNNKFTLDARASKITSSGYIDRASSNLQSYYLAAGYYAKKSIIKFINFLGQEKTYQAWNLVNEDSIKNGNRTYNELGMYTDGDGQLKYYKNQIDNYKQNNFQLHFIHRLSAKSSFNVTGHYTKGKGYYEEYKSNQLFTNYKMALPHLFLNDSTPVNTTDLVRRRWLDNDFAGGLFNFNYTINSQLSVKIGGGYNSYFGRHFGRVIWAQYAASKEIDYEYYFNTANKNDGNLYLKTNYKPLSNLNVFIDLQVRKVDYRFLGFNALFENQIENKSYLFFNPKFGVSYDLNKSINLYASGSIANKEPNRNDFVENKPENRPMHEALLDLEAGAKYSNKFVVAALNVYNMQYKNQLVLNGQLNDVGASKRINVGKSYRRGVELEVTINASKYISLGGNLALSRNKIEKFVEFIDSSNADYSIYTQRKNEYKNTNISFSPNLVSSAIISIKPIKRLEISVINKYVGRQYLDNTSNVKRSINPYQTYDVQINYTIKTKLIPEITFMLSLYNLLSKTYETNGYTFSYYYDSEILTTTNYLAPAAPFNFLGGVKFVFN